MNKRHLITLSLLLLLLTLGSQAALAHESREVGPYEVRFGWRVEPAVTGALNGPLLTVRVAESSEPVEGLEETLHFEITFGDQTKELEVKRVSSNPGQYTAHLIPTQAGDYTIRVTGMIGETEIDETFISTVTVMSDLAFPAGTDYETRLSTLESLIAELQAGH